MRQKALNCSHTGLHISDTKQYTSNTYTNQNESKYFTMNLTIRFHFYSIKSYSRRVRGPAAGYLHCHLSLARTGPESKTEKQKSSNIWKYFQILQVNLKKHQWSEKEFYVLWCLSDFTYLERWVVLSNFYGNRIWHLVTVVFHRYQRVIDEAGTVSQVPCCCQNQESITRQEGEKDRLLECVCFLGFFFAVFCFVLFFPLRLCFTTQPWLSWNSQRSKVMCHQTL